MRTKRPVMVVATGEVEVGVKESEMEMTMKVDRLRDILSLHAKWLRGEKGGRRANLAYANLAGAELAGANLTHADLTSIKNESRQMV